MTVDSKWPRLLARTLVILVWPLIWVGGLVTTYDAGMSVPDWPGTYGYNLFLYPLSTWLLGPFDLFIEHGHRLLGALVGFVAIGFLIATWRSESRRWVVWLAVFVLLAVIGQGVLGGLRVRMSDRTLAMVHGCTGPAFFALCVIAACVVGPKWRREAVQNTAKTRPERTPWKVWPLLLVGMAYAQVVLGAQLRHALPTASSSSFALTTSMHVLTAFLLWGATWISWWRMRRCGDLDAVASCRSPDMLCGPANPAGHRHVGDELRVSVDSAFLASSKLLSVAIQKHVGCLDCDGDTLRWVR